MSPSVGILVGSKSDLPVMEKCTNRFDDFGIDYELEVRSAGGQGSHQLATLAASDALAILPDGPGVPAGGTVRVLLLGDR